jgi:hypothetical protein
MVFGRGAAVRGGNPVVVGVLSFHFVAVWPNEPLVLRHLGEGWPKLPSPLDAVRNSLVESSIVARCELSPQKWHLHWGRGSDHRSSRQLMGSPRENSLHVRRSSLAVTVLEDDGTIRTIHTKTTL